MLCGYVQVSTKSQNSNLQIDALLKEGVTEKNIYRDFSSGAKSERHDLDTMISRLREGDMPLGAVLTFQQFLQGSVAF